MNHPGTSGGNVALQIPHRLLVISEIHFKEVDPFSVNYGKSPKVYPSFFSGSIGEFGTIATA
jgi:hypothetical protein